MQGQRRNKKQLKQLCGTHAQRKPTVAAPAQAFSQARGSNTEQQLHSSLQHADFLLAQVCCHLLVNAVLRTRAAMPDSHVNDHTLNIRTENPAQNSNNV